jgi:hypothetical protein
MMNCSGEKRLRANLVVIAQPPRPTRATTPVRNFGLPAQPRPEEPPEARVTLFGSLGDREIGLIGCRKRVRNALDRRSQIRDQPIAISGMDAGGMPH